MSFAETCNATYGTGFPCNAMRFLRNAIGMQSYMTNENKMLTINFTSLQKAKRPSRSFDTISPYQTCGEFSCFILELKNNLKYCNDHPYLLEILQPGLWNLFYLWQKCKLIECSCQNYTCRFFVRFLGVKKIFNTICINTIWLFRPRLRPKSTTQRNL